MTSTNVRVQMQQRRDTAANWTSANPTLLNGELGYETDTSKWKIGDGSTAWTSLGYTAWSQISYPIATADIADDAVTGAKLANNIDIAGTLDVTSAATFDNNVTIEGDLTVNGTTTTIDTTTLVVEDKNIEMGSVSTPTDVTADGGGITLKGATDKTINWVDSTDAWTLSEHVNIASGKEYRIAGTKVLDATSLGADTGLQFGTDEIQLVTGGTNRATVESNGNFTIEDGNLVVAAGHGIDFSADANAPGMTSELLDDYEEGTWTPTYLGASTAGSYTISPSASQYTKVGNIVHLQIDLKNITTVTAGTGSLRIGGLPFTPTNGNGAGSIILDNFTFPSSTNYAVVRANTSGLLSIVAMRDGTTDTEFGVTSKDSDTADIFGSISYFVD